MILMTINNIKICANDDNDNDDDNGRSGSKQ